jgi:23S rRNA pseudouridine2605 synthase
MNSEPDSEPLGADIDQRAAGDRLSDGRLDRTGSHLDSSSRGDRPGAGAEPPGEIGPSEPSEPGNARLCGPPETKVPADRVAAAAPVGAAGSDETAAPDASVGARPSIEHDPGSAELAAGRGGPSNAAPIDGSPAASGELIRLQKVLASAGVGSRRACEILIATGRVSVDGVVVDQLGARVDPGTAEVAVDGRRVSVRPGLVYLALNKPRGILSAMSDDRGRATVGDLVRDRPERLFHVGRLDSDSEGLLLLTNDGPLANGLMHPSQGVPKTYLAEVEGSVSRDITRTLLHGVELDDGFIRVDTVRIIERLGERTLVEVVLHEGRNRIVRRLLAAVGHPVRRLVRTAIGPLQLGGQRPGVLRELSQDEVSSLYSYIDKPTNRQTE